MSDTRSQLKQIAIEQIRRRTLHAASFRELGKVAGIKSSSVHYHFENRDALLLELVKDYEQDFFIQLKQRCHELSDPGQQLQQLAALFLLSQQSQYQCLCLAFAAAGDETNDQQRAAVEQFLQRLETWISAVLARAADHPDSAPQLARVILSALEGALLLDRDQPQAPRLNAVSQWLTTLIRSHSDQQPETL